MKDADELYVTGYEELIAEAINIWETHAERYANNLARYRALLEEKRRLNIRPLKSINRTMLDNYPDIPFLKAKTIDEAMNFIANMKKKEVRRLIIEIQKILLYNYCFNTISSWVSEAEYLVSNHGRKTRLGIDPESVSTIRWPRSRSSKD